jgi:hypothetical protein
MDVVEQQTENLELHTNALQILLGEPNTSTTVQSHSTPYSLCPSPPLCSAKPSPPQI